MDEWTPAILTTLVRTALVQLVAMGVIAVLLRGRCQNQPGTCRWFCFLVLLQGWTLIPLTVAIPWYEPPPDPVLLTLAGHSPTDGWSVESGRAGWPAAGDEAARAAGAEFAAPSDDAVAWRTRFSAGTMVAARAILGIWFAGIAWVTIGMVIRYRRFASRLKNYTDPCAAWNAEWQSLLEQHGVRRTIRLLVSEREGPMLCQRAAGPVVVVPAHLWRRLSPTARRWILRHELAHYLRGDLWKSLLARLLVLPQWFHPGAWWAARMYDQCAEWLCDRFVASEATERIDYARALAQLAALRLPVHAVGSCAHSHPLVDRVRFLLANPTKENPLMHRALLLAVAVAVFVAGTVRVELVAKDGIHTKESVEAKVDELDQTVAKLVATSVELKEKAAALKEQVEARISEAKGMYEAGNLSDEMRRCEAALRSGDQARQLDVLAGAKSRGDEGLVLLGMLAGHSNHQTVRRNALQNAFRVGVGAAPVFVYAFETLPDEDRIFLAEQLAKYSTPECIIGLGALVGHAGPEVQQAAIRSAAASRQRLLLFAVIAQNVKDRPAVVSKLVEQAAQVQGEDGLVALYALAKYGDANLKIKAVTAASRYEQEGFPVLVAAYHAKEPAVRTAVVRAAKAIGGDLAEQGIRIALADPDAELRQAAEKALQDAAANN
ncbi:MAG: M56 family metallopeptidase [Pirellulaceae bacterium]|nr:M56 family metallopeptidase [Pirellulaceae bacterium]